MKILEPGHIYELNTIDGKDGETETLRFVNRESGTEHPGTQTQEVLRALIDRTMHCDNCRRWAGNDRIIHHLRMALVLHEARALERKTEKGDLQPEKVDVSRFDGHFQINEEIRSDRLSPDAVKYGHKAKGPGAEGKPAMFYGADGQPEKDKIAISVLVNGQKKVAPKVEMAYEDVLLLIDNPRKALYTMIYHLPDKRHGTLIPGHSIKIQPGTRFEAVVTDNA